MKKVVLSFAIAAIALGASAQESSKSFQVSAGIKAALPIGDLGDATSFGIGAQVGAEKFFSDNFSGVASVDYTYFMGKEDKDLGVKINYSMMPVLVGVRYYAAPSFFIGAKAGLGVFSASVSGASASTTGFAYEPQIGFNSEKIQITLNYTTISNQGSVSAIGLGAAYKF